MQKTHKELSDSIKTTKNEIDRLEKTLNCLRKSCETIDKDRVRSRKNTEKELAYLRRRLSELTRELEVTPEEIALLHAQEGPTEEVVRRICERTRLTVLGKLSEGLEGETFPGGRSEVTERHTINNERWVVWTSAYETHVNIIVEPDADTPNTSIHILMDAFRDDIHLIKVEVVSLEESTLRSFPADVKLSESGLKVTLKNVEATGVSVQEAVRLECESTKAFMNVMVTQ